MIITLQADAAEQFQTYLQDPATQTMEGLLDFNGHLLILITSIVGFVGWLLFSTIYSFEELKGPQKLPLFVHSKELEITWTSLPALILLMLASPSFALLYSMDEIATPEISLKILGHQWFWSYEISDFVGYNGNPIKFKYVCYLLSSEDLQLKDEMGYFRLLETNKRVILPTNIHIRLLISSADVLHSWTIPSLGVKVDACPGRLNAANIFLKRFGLFYGQCSEICGVNHGFMPISLIVVPSLKFHGFLVALANSDS
jgi:cytochrome c oxidase subunit 2